MISCLQEMNTNIELLDDTRNDVFDESHCSHYSGNDTESNIEEHQSELIEYTEIFKNYCCLAKVLFVGELNVEKLPVENSLCDLF